MQISLPAIVCMTLASWWREVWRDVGADPRCGDTFTIWRRATQTTERVTVEAVDEHNGKPVRVWVVVASEADRSEARGAISISRWILLCRARAVRGGGE